MAMAINTGFEGLDEILCNVRKGDNVVWQVDSIEDYHRFTKPFVTETIRENIPLVYMRFAKHDPLVEAQPGVKIYYLDAESGFERFSAQVHNIISKEGVGVFYVFDCLSDLLQAWATDLMIGNFFMVTCPYLFELDTVAYFGILRNHHSLKTVARIRETTQLLLDLYHSDDHFYVHPLKVWNRYSPTMFLPHIMQGNKLSPILSSVDAASLLNHISEKGMAGAKRVLDHWDRLFLTAEEFLDEPKDSAGVKEIKEKLCKLIIGNEERISNLAIENFDLRDLLNIKGRMIGSGFIGGKAVGMLVAQKILFNDPQFDARSKLEHHDSFYVGSDVFYSFIVENGWWKTHMRQKRDEEYFSLAGELKDKMLRGKFPDEIRERFQEMIEYFGQSPIIVRSSSLLEDSFGNAFAGKYESIFLANQGSPDQRYAEFENAVRRVYASTLNEDALTYRVQRNLQYNDEQMALLVQRVSGSHRKQYFFPDMAGVGVSYNTFVWKGHLDPRAGMLRLVFGLGTRAVDRVEDDYPRIIALDDPLLRPHAGMEDIIRYSQHKIDLLDTAENNLLTKDVNKLLGEDLPLDMSLIAVADTQAMAEMKKLGIEGQRWVVTFEKLLRETDFTETMQRILKILEENYSYPVDIEFTANFTLPEGFRINLVQCRPLQAKGTRPKVEIPKDIDASKILFRSVGGSMGGNLSQNIKRVLYIDPAKYVDLDISSKYELARLVGKINKQVESRKSAGMMLLGPGRWGTTTPSLGVPVSFAEINNAKVLVEIAYEGGNLMPELSFGTHFFQDLVETEIFYVALFPGKEEVVFNREMIKSQRNLLTELVAEAGKFSDVLTVCDLEGLHIMCDVVSQEVVCFAD